MVLEWYGIQSSSFAAVTSNHNPPTDGDLASIETEKGEKGVYFMNGMLFKWYHARFPSSNYKTI